MDLANLFKADIVDVGIGHVTIELTAWSVKTATPGVLSISIYILSAFVLTVLYLQHTAASCCL